MNHDILSLIKTTASIVEAALAIGVAQASFTQALSYASQRKQFGRTIINFQGLQFMMADMATFIEAARLMVYEAAWQQKNGTSSFGHAAMARVFATQAAVDVTTKAVQIHGGYGYTQSYAVERLMRDARGLGLFTGSNDEARESIYLYIEM